MNITLKQIADQIKENSYESSGHLYHPLPFPEFSQLKTSSKAGTATRKLEFTLSFIGPSDFINQAKVIDVGANAGFFAFSFAQLGAIVDAYEPHAHYSDIGRKIVEATNLPVSWHNKPLECGDLHNKKYDIALMFSVFQWISEGNKQLDYATTLLRTLASSTKILFFELGCNQGKSAIRTEERPIGWIWRLLQINTSPKRVVYLGGTTAWGRARRYIFACTDGSIKNLTTWQRAVTRLLERSWIR